MLVGGLEDLYAGLVEPTLHPLDDFLERQGTLMKAWVCSNSDEGVQHRPAQSHGL